MMNSYTHYFLVFFVILLYSFALSHHTESIYDRYSKPSHYRSSESQVSSWFSSNTPRVFSVLSYGAVGDGSSDDTDAFIKCWDAACHADTSAVFLVPKGRKFMIQYTKFSGPCRNLLVFRIQGHIVAPDGPDRWLESNKLFWLVFEGIKGMTVEGEGGLLDGKGKQWWNLSCKPHRGPNGKTLPGPCDSPIAIVFISCSKLLVHKLQIKNSPLFHVWLEGCDDVLIDSLNIRSPAGSPNTDGVHLHKSNHVKIYSSSIANGDDCISIGAGSYNVDIRNLTCGPGHGISIGSLGMKNRRECVSNITVRDTVIKHSDNGLRIKTWQGGSGSVSGVTYDNIRMDTVRNPIIITQYYCDKSSACPNQTSAVYVTGIVYKNIEGTYNATRPPVYFACSDSVPCTNLALRNVKLEPARSQKKVKPFCWKAQGDAYETTPSVDCLVKKRLPIPRISKC